MDLCNAINSLKIPNPLKLSLLSMVGTLGGFWLPNLVYYIIWKADWLTKYKIQGPKMPKDALIKKELIENAIGMVTTIPLFAALSAMLFSLGGAKSKSSNSKKAGDKAKTESSDGVGWANLRWSGKSPSILQLYKTVGIAYLLYDAMFYWTHRLLHRKDLFLKIHRVHHQFKTPVGISASYSQFYETMAQIFMWWVPLGLAGWMTGDLHSTTIFWYHIFRWLETVEAHSGYDIPFHPIHFFLLPSGARFHDYHHSHFDGNYGASIIWDRLMGTNKDYLEFLKRNQEKAALLAK